MPTELSGNEPDKVPERVKRLIKEGATHIVLEKENGTWKITAR